MSDNLEPKDGKQSEEFDIVKEIAEEVQIAVKKDRGFLLSLVVATMFFVGPVLSLLVMFLPDLLPSIIENISFSFSILFFVAVIVNSFILSRS